MLFLSLSLFAIIIYLVHRFTMELHMGDTLVGGTDVWKIRDPARQFQCPVCGRDVNPAWRYCPVCGTVNAISRPKQ